MAPAQGSAAPEATGSMARRRGGGSAGELLHARLLAATIALLAERGSTEVSVASIARRAHVSRGLFYTRFADREACVAAAIAHACELVRERAAAACHAEHGWRRQTRAVLHAVLELFEERPDIGALLVLQSGSPDPVLGAHRSELLREATALIEAGAQEKRRSRSPVSGEVLAAGVLGVIGTRLLTPGGEPLSALLNELMALIVLPYRGSRAAAGELSAPPPRTGGAIASRGGPRVREVDARRVELFTYRTMRVLVALGEHAPLSNAQVAERAEIKDQGQVSKLLHRLAREGLIGNGRRRAPGPANAWELTSAGLHAVAAIERDGLIARAVGSRRSAVAR